MTTEVSPIAKIKQITMQLRAKHDEQDPVARRARIQLMSERSALLSALKRTNVKAYRALVLKLSIRQ